MGNPGLEKRSTAKSKLEIEELIKQIRNRTIPTNQIQELVKTALEHQGDRATEWSPAWGDLIHAAGETGQLTKEDWYQYVQQIYEPSLFIREPVRIGDPIVFLMDMKLDDERKGEAPLVGRVEVKSFSINNREVGRLPAGLSGSPLKGLRRKSGRFHGKIGPHLLSKFPLAPGEHEVTYTAAIEATSAWETGNDMAVTIPITFTRMLTFVGTEEQTVTLIWDKSIAEALKKSIRIENVRMSPTSRGSSEVSPLVNVKAELTIGPAPVDLAFYVYLRQGKKVRLLAQFSRRAGGSGGMWRLSAQLWGLGDAPVDIILQPNRKEAATTLTIKRILGNEITLHNVPVEWSIE